jgi:hypothetical protein
MVTPQVSADVVGIERARAFIAAILVTFLTCSPSLVSPELDFAFVFLHQGRQVCSILSEFSEVDLRASGYNIRRKTPRIGW